MSANHLLKKTGAVLAVAGLAALALYLTPRQSPGTGWFGEAKADTPSKKRVSYSVSLGIETTKAFTSRQKTMELVKRMGGFLEESQLTSWNDNDGVTHANAKIVARAPAAKLDELMRKVMGLGKVAVQARNMEDLTAEYREKEIQISQSKSMEARWGELKQRPGKVAEFLEVDKTLTALQKERFAMEGELRSMDERLAYATLSVEFGEKISRGIESYGKSLSIR